MKFASTLYLSLLLCLSCSGADKRIQDTYNKLNATQELLKDDEVHIVTTDNTPEDSLEFVHSASGINEQVIHHIGYTTSYNDQTCTPNWVSYSVTNEEISGTANRKLSTFMPDPLVKGKTATTYDYRGTGWDRGHMAPAGDMKWSQQAMNESFYLSNVCPQSKPLNTGLWRVLEERVRKWAKVYGTVYVVCGPLYDAKPKTIGSNDVAIPSQFFKVLLRPQKDGGYQGMGFLFPNEDCNGEIYNYAVSIDEIEQLTSHDFFYNLDDDVEERVESVLNINAWK